MSRAQPKIESLIFGRTSLERHEIREKFIPERSYFSLEYKKVMVVLRKSSRRNFNQLRRRQ